MACCHHDWPTRLLSPPDGWQLGDVDGVRYAGGQGPRMRWGLPLSYARRVDQLARRRDAPRRRWWCT